jgi:hypothetical protein
MAKVRLRVNMASTSNIDPRATAPVPTAERLPVTPKHAPAGFIPMQGRARRYRGIYAFHHTQRFEWMRRKLNLFGRQDISIIELGCADATSLDYVPVSVRRYLGFDAAWRSGWRNGEPYGFDAALERHRGQPYIQFQKSTHYADIARVHEKFDVGLVLETFEYMELSQLESYIATLADKIDKRGCILSTMPNEKGLPLLVKAIGSKLTGVRRSEYSLHELMNAVLGRMDRVPRAERGRKGFDYEAVARIARRYFAYVHLQSVGFPALPKSISLNVGMIAAHEPIPALFNTARATQANAARNGD